MRMFPPLRAAWARLGEQAEVSVTGRNDRRELFGAINVRSGRRIVVAERRLNQFTFQGFLREIRRRYRKGEIQLILDQNSAHTAKASAQLAKRLGIALHLLPKQTPELNAIDHLWRHVKEHTAANRQYETVDDLAESARDWTLGLSNKQALRKSGLLAPNSWLKRVSQNLRGPT